MDILLSILIVAVVVGLVYWAASAIPFPPPLVFLRWLLPLIAVVWALIWLWPQLGLSTGT